MGARPTTSNYAFAGGKDAAGFKRLLKDFSADEIRNRIVRYLQDPDAFFAMQRHPLEHLLLARSTGSAPSPHRGRAPRRLQPQPPVQDRRRAHAPADAAAARRQLQAVKENRPWNRQRTEPINGQEQETTPTPTLKKKREINRRTMRGSIGLDPG